MSKVEFWKEEIQIYNPKTILFQIKHKRLIWAIRLVLFSENYLISDGSLKHTHVLRRAENI